MASFLRAYNSALLHRPLRTQIVTSLALFGGGDVIAQQFIEKKGKEHDFMRSARLASYGGFIFAPLGTRWFKTLNFIKFKNHSVSSLLKMGLDQFVAAPTMIAFFFVTMNFLEGNDLKHGEERLKQKWGPTLWKNWMVFVPLQTFNFFLVPSHLRLLLVNGASLFWNCYLSYVNSSIPPFVEEIANSVQGNNLKLV
ncbi:hypothetical protein PPACK8108_LOCUS7618 [Phakopsora pachyrhizi]|uniref:Uncharacterized protein n=1 Tax=Phakopsora pachyrhizi TaxID=170000 RepID=A0AAV0ATA2_PHAPC|nr:hypothetical protein PPACK8108_LOCUS7618 [Phakopsora pachyrhizi]